MASGLPQREASRTAIAQSSATSRSVRGGLPPGPDVTPRPLGRRSRGQNWSTRLRAPPRPLEAELGSAAGVGRWATVVGGDEGLAGNGETPPMYNSVT